MSVYEPEINFNENDFSTFKGREQILNEIRFNLQKIAECLKALDLEDNFTEQARKDITEGYTGNFKDRDGHNIYVKNGKITKRS